MNYNQISDLQLPDPSKEVLRNSDLRHCIVKASAYITFALEESQTPHSRDLKSAIVVATTHDLNLSLSPDEYIKRAIQELATAEGELEETSDYRQEIKRTRETLSNLATH